MDYFYCLWRTNIYFRMLLHLYITHSLFLEMTSDDIIYDPR